MIKILNKLKKNKKKINNLIMSLFIILMNIKTNLVIKKYNSEIIKLNLKFSKFLITLFWVSKNLDKIQLFTGSSQFCGSNPLSYLKLLN